MCEHYTAHAHAPHSFTWCCQNHIRKPQVLEGKQNGEQEAEAEEVRSGHQGDVYLDSYQPVRPSALSFPALQPRPPSPLPPLLRSAASGGPPHPHLASESAPTSSSCSYSPLGPHPSPLQSPSIAQSWDGVWSAPLPLLFVFPCLLLSVPFPPWFHFPLPLPLHLLLLLNHFLSVLANFPLFFYISLIVFGSLFLNFPLSHSVSGSFYMPSTEELLNIDECLFFLSVFLSASVWLLLWRLFFFFFPFLFCIPILHSILARRFQGTAFRPPFLSCPLPSLDAFVTFSTWAWLLARTNTVGMGNPHFLASFSPLLKWRWGTVYCCLQWLTCPLSIQDYIPPHCNGFGLGHVICFGPQNVTESMSEH